MSFQTTEHSGIANLAAAFAIKRRLVDDDPASFALCERISLLAFFYDGQYLTFGQFGVVSQKFGRAELFGNVEPDRGVLGFTGTRPGSPGFGLLFSHGCVKSIRVNGKALFP